MAPDRTSRLALDILGLAYAVVTFLGLAAVILVIWPSNPEMTRWAHYLSDEGRFVAIAVCGGALGCLFKAMLKTLNADAADTDWRVSRQIVRVCVAVQASVMIFIAIRSFVLLPTSSVLNLSPFGVLFVSFGVGWIADNVLMQALERIAFTHATAALGEQIDSIANAVGVATLDNYQGHLCVEVLDETMQPLPAHAPRDLTAPPDPPSPPGSEAPRVLLRANQTYNIRAWFDPRAPDLVASEEVVVTGGDDVAEVSFVVVADSSSDVRFAPPRQVFSFDPRQSSLRSTFQFVAPVIESPFRIWLRASQKGRLVAVVALEASLGDSYIPMESRE